MSAPSPTTERAGGADGGPTAPPGPRLTLRGRVLVLFGVFALAVLAVVGLLWYALAELAHRRADVVDRLDPAALEVGDLRTAMLDQETGLRGFVLSGDTNFLEPYLSGQTNGDAALDRLDQLLVGTPLVEQEMPAVRAAVDAWRTDYATPRIKDAVSDGPGAVSGSYLEGSRTAFDQVRAAIDDVDGAIEAERSDALDAWESAYRGVVVSTVAAVGLLLLAAVLVYVGLRRWVTRPIEELASEVQLVARGSLGEEVHGTGPPELVHLGDDVEAMRRRIVEELDKITAANAAIAQQALELERSNADLEQFAYVASHDLQEPLRKVAGFCQLLERRYRGQLDEKADQYIDFVVDGAKRMQDLINDLLSFSRVGRTTDRFVSVDLGAAAAAAVANLGTGPDEQGATIDIGELPTVQGDPRLLTSLLQNLIGNAVKFRGEEPPRVVVRATTDDDAQVCTLSVSDNGIGISPEYAEQIFTLFQRLHNRSQYDGTGIGLALCKKIAEFHGGSIRLDTERDGPGATFVVTLPLDAEIPTPVTVVAQDPPTPNGAGAPEPAGTTAPGEVAPA